MVEIKLQTIGIQGPEGIQGQKGLNWLGVWSNVTTYQVDDAIEYQGTSYVCLAQNTNDTPPSVNWVLLAQEGATGPQGSTGATGTTGSPGPQGPVGITWQGAWSNATTYQPNDGVESGGNSYIALVQNTNDLPPSANWDLVAQKGLDDKTYIHNQAAPLATWNVVHSLGKNPSVSVVDSAGTEVMGQVDYIDTNNLVLKFSAAFAGKAYCN